MSQVADWMTSWNVMPKPRVMSFDMLPSIEETPRRSNLETSAAASASGRGKDAKPASGRSCMAQVSRQLTVMKKRVLKRVIARNGEEILLTPSPTLSRQSSADISDLSEDDQAGRSEDKAKKKLEKNSDRRSTAPERARATTASDARAFDEHEDRKEDFSNNSCNITLSITSFEDEGAEEEKEEEQREEEVKKAREKNLPVPLASPLRQRPKSPRSFKENSPTTYDMTPGMYPSTPKRPVKTLESPIHISVRSQLLGPSSSHETGLYTITNNTGEDGSGPEKGDHTSVLGRHLSVVPLCASTSTSDEASDITDFDCSPRRTEDFAHEFPDVCESLDANLSSHALASETVSPTSEHSALSTSSSNRRRFEESLSQRDGDADDSPNTCSQLVSALTELKPGPVASKKGMGRSYSDGGRRGGAGKGEHQCNVCLKGTDGEEGGYRLWSGEPTGRGID